MLMQVSEELRQLLDPNCNYPNCGCPLLGDVMKPLNPSTMVLSIHGRQDLVVGQMAQTTNEGENAYVNASHVGLVYNPDAYRVIARFLTREPLTDRAMPFKRRTRPVFLKVSGEP
jgi:hypothetical protein